MKFKKSEFLPKLKLLASVNNIIKFKPINNVTIGMSSGGSSFSHIKMKVFDGVLPECCVSATDITRTIVEMDDEIDIDVKNGKMFISDKETNLKLITINASISELSDGKILTKWGKKEITAFLDASVLSLKESGNPYSSVICEQKDGWAQFIGSERINVYRNIIESDGDPYKFAIPLASVKMINDLANMYGDDVEIHESGGGNVICFAWNGCYYFTPTITMDVDFSPLFGEIKNPQCVVTINKEDLQTAIKTISSAARTTHGCILKVEPNSINLSVKTETIEAEKIIKAKMEGTPITVKVNYNTLNLFCEVSSAKEIIISFENNKSPIMVYDGSSWFGKSNLMTYNPTGE